MKGLVIKDLLSMRTALPLLVVMLCVPMLIAVIPAAVGAQTVSAGVLSVLYVAFAGMVCILNVVTSLSFASYDEQCGWDTFGAALPVSRAKVVLARYGAGALLLLGSVAALLLVQFFCLIGVGQPMDGYSPAAIVMICLTVEGVMHPIMYRFGAQIGGYIFAGTAMLFGLGMTALGRYMGEMSEMSEEEIDALIEQALSGHYFAIAAVIGVAVSAVLYGLSILLSVRIYQKKEF